MGFYKPSAQQLALACGAAGAYVEVTDDLITDTISGVWGRNSGFSDTRPGVFSFDLVNDAGKYTPGNASSALATKVRVGMGVHHIVDGVHFGGTIRSTQPYFTGPASLAGSSKIRVTCDDMLGDAARHQITDLNDDLIRASSPFLWWPLDDVASSAQAREAITGAQPLLVDPLTAPSPPPAAAVFGGTTPFPSGSGVALNPGGGAFSPYLVRSITDTYSYGSATVGAFGFWAQLSGAGIQFSWKIRGLSGVSGNVFLNISLDGSVNMTASPSGLSVLSTIDSAPHWISINTATTYVGGFWQIAYSLYVDNVLVGTSTAVTGISAPTLPDAARSPGTVYLVGTGTATFPALFADMVHGLTLPDPTKLYAPTEAKAISAIDAVSPEITLDTLPALSPVALGPINYSSAGTLDALNDVVRTEQGSIWVETTGSLLSPVPKLKIRERSRPATVDAAHTFSISEILNAPQFTTDIENMVWAATAAGSVTSQTASDSSLIPYVGSASDSTSVLLRDPIDLLAWAQDRLLRGKATDVRLPQFTVDALQINRWADVSALRAGDRLRVSVPVEQLGVSYIDGWVLGCSYSLQYPSLNGDDQMLFTFTLQPVLAAGGIYDTSVYDTAIYAF